MTKDEVLAEVLECMEAAIKSGDWKVDGACDPTMTIERMKHALEAKDEPIGSFMTRLQAIDFLLKMRPQTEPTEKQIIATIDAYSALFGDMIESPVLPKQEAKDEPVAHSVVAGALFDFMGWLTSREKRLILSSVDEASPAVEAITEFAKKRNLSLKYAEVGYWMEFLSTPSHQEAKDEPVGTAGELFSNTALERLDLRPSTNIYITPLPVAEPYKRKPLTDEEIGAILEGVNAYGTRLYTFARAIEAAHGIKGEA